MSRTEQIAKFKKAVKVCKGKTRSGFRSCMRKNLSKKVNSYRRKHTRK